MSTLMISAANSYLTSHPSDMWKTQTFVVYKTKYLIYVV